MIHSSNQMVPEMTMQIALKKPALRARKKPQTVNAERADRIADQIAE